MPRWQSFLSWPLKEKEHEGESFSGGRGAGRSGVADGESAAPAANGGCGSVRRPGFGGDFGADSVDDAVARRGKALRAKANPAGGNPFPDDCAGRVGAESGAVEVGRPTDLWARRRRDGGAAESGRGVRSCAGSY